MTKLSSQEGKETPRKRKKKTTKTLGIKLSWGHLLVLEFEKVRF